MTEIVTRTPMQEIVAQIRGDQFKQQIASALPGGVTSDRFVRVTVTALNQSPDLITVDRSSLFAAVIRCAQDGLLPDGREAALVKFGNMAAYLPMIGGFRKLAAEAGWAIDTQVVYANDEFVYELGLRPVLVHKPPRLDADRGEKIGAYAVCTHADGRKQVEVMGKADIQRVQAVSKQKNGPLWTTWEDRAWEKTVGRRAFGKLPRDGRDSERITRVLAAADSEYDVATPASMTVDEANVSASLGPVRPPQTPPPDDDRADFGPVEDADWSDAVEVDPGEQASFADRIPPGARGET